MSKPDREALDKALFEAAGDERLYAIVDGARHDDIYPAVETANPNTRCLYKGSLTEELKKAAPHLVLVLPGRPFLGKVLEKGFGDNWGIFLTSKASLDELEKHFRRFLMVKTEDGDELYFRYYDPRVFRLYLPTCNPEEAEFIFGPVSAYLMESEDGSKLLKYAREGEVVAETSALSA